MTFRNSWQKINVNGTERENGGWGVEEGWGGGVRWLSAAGGRERETETDRQTETRTKS